ncbi:MAG: hypothetical protein ACKO1M_08800 [Planctomycetota bacterium]
MTTEAVVATTDFAAGVSATTAVSAEPVLAIPQHVAAGTTIREATIVSQQAGRR